jgi:hypothetical protein
MAHEEIRDAVRRYAREQLAPNAARWDHDKEFPREALKGLAAMGLYGIAIPEEWGGAGLDYTAMAIASEELMGRSESAETAARYYMNPAITSDRNACRFRKEFVPVFEAGRHEFFREPDADERRALASSEPAECARYKAALELKKKQAKAAAEKRRKAQAAKLKGKRSKVARR